MKKLLFTSLVVLAVSCVEHEEIDPYHPKRPADVPLKLKHGEPIEWDWHRQRAYNEGRIFFHKDSTGGVIAVIIKTR